MLLTGVHGKLSEIEAKGIRVSLKSGIAAQTKAGLT